MLDFKKNYDSSYFKILIIGFVLGLWSALIVWGTQRAIKNYYDTNPIQQSITSSKKAPSNYLTVSSPKDETVQTSNFATVTGTAGPGSKIVVINGEKTVSADVVANGSFSIEVPLIEGVNDLKITAFSNLGEDSTVTRTVIFTEESID